MRPSSRLSRDSDDRDEVHTGGTDRPGAGDRPVMARLAPPSEHLLWTQLPAARHIGHPRAGLQRLRHDPGLLLGGPTPPPTGAGQYLNAPETALRVVANVEHNDGSKPPASSQISTVSQNAPRGPRGIAYPSSTPDTRTTAPASSTSMTGVTTAAVREGSSGGGASAMIGTSSTLAGLAGITQPTEPSWRASRRHPNTAADTIASGAPRRPPVRRPPGSPPRSGPSPRRTNAAAAHGRSISQCAGSHPSRRH
jgi:hypothetical protein